VLICVDSTDTVETLTKRLLKKVDIDIGRYNPFYFTLFEISNTVESINE